MNKIRIIFVCLGNICRSPMAEYIAKDIIEKQGLSHYFEITSAATSREEIGNDIYPPAMRALQSHGIRYDRHSARQITNDDYINNDYIIAMDKSNIRNLNKYFDDRQNHKISLLMSYANEDRDIADPWYTGDFDKAYNDIERSCKALIDKLKTTHHINKVSLFNINLLFWHKQAGGRADNGNDRNEVIFWCRIFNLKKNRIFAGEMRDLGLLANRPKRHDASA